MLRDDYHVALLCGLHLESVAVWAFLDEVHESLSLEPDDFATWAFGRIANHNVIIGSLPAGSYGPSAINTTLSLLRTNFRAIRIFLSVGIGGGVPNARNDIRLGDVVVSQPSGSSSGLIQYDLGKMVEEDVSVRARSLNPPPTVLLEAIATLRAHDILTESGVARNMAEALQRYPRIRSKYACPGQQYDILFQPAYRHQSGDDTCQACDAGQQISRPLRLDDGPVIHYGTIASSNYVLSDGITRDQISADLGTLCFEMEAAGMMSSVPCLVIRGVCDYADSHRSQQWQPYAALTAAAYAKELLKFVPIGATLEDETETVYPFNYDTPLHSGLEKQNEEFSRSSNDSGSFLGNNTLGDHASTKGTHALSTNQDSGYWTRPLPTSSTSDAAPHPSVQDKKDLHESDNVSLMTIDSESSLIGLSDQGREEFVAIFTNELLRSLGPSRSRIRNQANIINGLKDTLPDLLKSVTIKLLSGTNSAIMSELDELNKYSVRLLRKYRKRIAQEFQKHLISSSYLSDPGVKNLVDAAEMLKSQIASRTAKLAPSHVSSSDISSEDEDNDLFRPLPHPIQEIRSFIIQSEPYQALIEEIKSELFPSRKDAMVTIEQRIKSFYCNGEILKDVERIFSPISAHFEVFWDVRGFLMKNYSIGLFQCLRNIITINGDATNAEAVSCGLYADKHWGECGTKVLDTIQAALQSVSGTSSKYITPETELHIWLDVTTLSLRATVHGTLGDIIKLGQQLAWLGASCRDSPLSGVSMTTTIINSTQTDQNYPVFYLSYWDEKAQDTSNGKCWHSIFNSATIALGFPPSARYFGEVGLEIGMGMMIDLCSTPYAAIWNGGYVLKGFSTMLIPTARVHDSSSVQWHLLHDASGARIPYHCLDGLKRCQMAGLTLDFITTGRAFLGWCSSVECTIGTSKLSCIPGFSGLEECGPGYGLSSLSVSGGKYISVIGSFEKGEKDKAIHITRETCFLKLVKDLKKSKVVLYKTKGRRAFLVDGAQAMLHLLRAGLKIEDYQLSSDALLLPSLDGVHKSISDFLLEMADTRLLEDKVIHEDGRRDHFYLKNLIFKTWYTLELLRDHESAVKFRGLEIPTSWHQMLFGWEFMSIAKENWSFQLKQTEVKSSAAGWIALIREAKALVLFAYDFGDIYLPRSLANKTEQACDSHRTLPSQKDLIAIPNSFLEELYEEAGCQDTRQRLTSSKISWLQRGHPFKPCARPECDDVAQELHYDSLACRFTQRNHLRPPKKLSANGAVIFGWNGSKMSWFNSYKKTTSAEVKPHDTELMPENDDTPETSLMGVVASHQVSVSSIPPQIEGLTSGSESATASQSTPPSSMASPAREGNQTKAKITKRMGQSFTRMFAKKGSSAE